MDIFNANLTPSPSPEDRATSNTKKTLQKPTPTKVTKRKTVTSSPMRELKNSPVPKTKAEMQPYDQLILDERAKDPPTPWKQIEGLFRAAGGITTGWDTLNKNRFAKLKAIGDDMSSKEASIGFCNFGSSEMADKKQLQDLVAAEAEIEMEYQKEKWSRVATHLKSVHDGKEWNAKFLQKQFDRVSKGSH